MHGYVNGPSINFNVNVADGNWHHIAMTRTSSSGHMQFIVDGQVRWSGTFEAGVKIKKGGCLVLAQENDATGPNCGGWENGQAYHGDQAEFTLWSKQLTLPEVRNLMHSPPKGDEDGLVLAYTDEVEYDAAGTPLSWRDITGNGHDATLRAGSPTPWFSGRDLNVNRPLHYIGNPAYSWGFVRRKNVPFPQEAFSTSMWFYTTVSRVGVLSYTNAQFTNHFLVFQNSPTQLRVILRNSNEITFEGVEAHRWHHIVIQRTTANGAVTVYRDTSVRANRACCVGLFGLTPLSTTTGARDADARRRHASRQRRRPRAAARGRRRRWPSVRAE